MISSCDCSQNDLADRAARRELVAAATLGGAPLALLLILFILPVLAIIVIAMTDWQFGAKQISFIGLANFNEMLGDSDIRRSLLNTLIYVVIVVPGTVIAGLSIALVIESGHRFRGFYQAIHFLPFMATLSAMAIAWEALLHPTAGLINHLLISIGLPPRNWLRDQTTVLPVLAGRRRRHRGSVRRLAKPAFQKRRPGARSAGVVVIFPGPFLYYSGRRLVPPPLRAFLDFIKEQPPSSQSRMRKA